MTILVMPAATVKSPSNEDINITKGVKVERVMSQ